jgi:outer membrane protein assembly factor BamB
MTVDGDVYAQPLYKGGTLFVATEHDSVYAFNSTDGTLLWKDSFINPAQGITAVPAADVKTYDIYPELGITGTPVIDGATDTLYVVSEYKQNIAGSSKYVQTFHALDLISGKEKFGGPTVIVSSSTDKSGKITSFDALLGLQRSALLLNNGVVYIAWASNGDHGPYHGWVIAYQANNIQNQLGVFNDTKNGKQGGIWMSGGGISSDGKYLYAAIGNGTFDPDNGDYGDSVIKFVLGGQKQFGLFFSLRSSIS